MQKKKPTRGEKFRIKTGWLEKLDILLLLDPLLSPLSFYIICLLFLLRIIICFHFYSSAQQQQHLAVFRLLRCERRATRPPSSFSLTLRSLSKEEKLWNISESDRKDREEWAWQQNLQHMEETRVYAKKHLRAFSHLHFPPREKFSRLFLYLISKGYLTGEKFLTELWSSARISCLSSYTATRLSLHPEKYVVTRTYHEKTRPHHRKVPRWKLIFQNSKFMKFRTRY